MKDDRTYKDFCDAFYELKKKNYDISYGRIAKKTGILEATVTALANRRRAHPPADEVIIAIAAAFNVRPDYFYDWRLKRFLEFINENRDFLDNCEKIRKGYNPPPQSKKETPKIANKSNGESTDDKSA
jgi:transcriptional regulator with XRE-family HTH domain